METILRLGLAIVLLLVTLSLASTILDPPLRMLRRTGGHRALRRVGRALGRMVVSLGRALTRRRRPRARRGRTRAPSTYFR